MTAIFAYITTSSPEEARRVADTVTGEHLARKVVSSPR
jgi:hypothetical protein